MSGNKEKPTNGFLNIIEELFWVDQIVFSDLVSIVEDQSKIDLLSEESSTILKDCGLLDENGNLFEGVDEALNQYLISGGEL